MGQDKLPLDTEIPEDGYPPIDGEVHDSPEIGSTLGEVGRELAEGESVLGQEITKLEQTQVTSPAQQVAAPGPMSPIEMVTQLKAAGVSIDDMKEMLALQKEYQAEEARKAFYIALTKFRANPPRISKNRDVSYKNKGGTLTEYSHATLDQVASAIGECLSKYGMSFGWKTEQLENNQVRVTCTLSHEHGHSESTSLTGAPDESGGKNSIQAVGSTITYLERYTLLALTGMASSDIDNDGAGGAAPEVDVVTINENQYLDLLTLLKDTGTDEEAFAKYCQVDNLRSLPAKKYDGAIIALKSKQQRQEAGNDNQ